MYKKLFLLFILGFIISILFQVFKTNAMPEHHTWWEFQSVDTMKYSRDLAREKISSVSFAEVINTQTKNIAGTGATHIAIATPYDDEFYPFLKRWVDAARRYNLKVWFRGNWAGWEGWFDYEKIDREEHIKKTEEFILKNQGLFQNGDIFTACPECENGGPGDPRLNGDATGHREFLIEEHKVMDEAFKKIGKAVNINYNSMNGDVARLVMDRETTEALGGIVTIDHYVATPEQLASDIKQIAASSGGKIVLGEFGAPIPDIHGAMSDEEQAGWLENTLSLLVETNEVVGMNYWTNTGSSTELWKSDGDKRQAADVLTSFYNGQKVTGRITDEASGSIKEAYITVGVRRFFVDERGSFSFPYFGHISTAKIEAAGFFGQEIIIDGPHEIEIVLQKENEDFLFKVRKFFNNLINIEIIF